MGRAVDELGDAHLLAVVEDPSTHRARGGECGRDDAAREARDDDATTARDDDATRRRATTRRDDARRRRRRATRDDAPAREDADADADAVARLRAEHPRATLVARRDDDARDGRARTTVTCEETRHAVSWTGETREAGARAMRRHLSGKKFARATARAASEADLKQYEPHIVPSAFRKGYVFCRLTGARVRAREEAVVRHASGRRFERAHAAAAAGRTTLLEERDPVVEEAAREAAREAQTRAGEREQGGEGGARGEDADGEGGEAGGEGRGGSQTPSAKPAASTTRWGAGCRRVTFSRATTTTRAKTARRTTRTTRTRRTGRMI